VIEKLACKLGRNDEAGVTEILNGFRGNDKAVASDCIKVLYEIGERNPKMISDYALDFVSALHSRNNRLAWGSMKALAAIAEYAAEPIFENLPLIISAYKNGK